MATRCTCLFDSWCGSVVNDVALLLQLNQVMQSAHVTNQQLQAQIQEMQKREAAMQAEMDDMRAKV